MFFSPGHHHLRLTVLLIVTLAGAAVSALPSWNGAYSRDEDYPGLPCLSGERDSDYPDILKLFSSAEESNTEATQGYNDAKEDFSLSLDTITGGGLDDQGYDPRPWLKSKYRSLSASNNNLNKKDSKYDIQDNRGHKYDKEIQKAEKENKSPNEIKPDEEANDNKITENSVKSETDIAAETSLNKAINKQHDLKSSEIKPNVDLFYHKPLQNINEVAKDDQIKLVINRPLQKKVEKVKTDIKDKMPVIENKEVLSKNAVGRGPFQNIRNMAGVKYVENLALSSQVQGSRREKLNQEEHKELHQMKVKGPDKFHRHQNKKSVQKMKLKTMPEEDADYEFAEPDSSGNGSQGEEADLKTLESRISEENENYQTIDSKVNVNLGDTSKISGELVSNVSSIGNVSLTASDPQVQNATNGHGVAMVHPIPGEKDPKLTTHRGGSNLGLSDILSKPPIKDLVEAGRKAMSIQPIAEKSDNVESKHSGEANPSGGQSENKTVGWTSLNDAYPKLSNPLLIDSTENVELKENYPKENGFEECHVLQKKSADSENAKDSGEKELDEDKYYYSVHKKETSPNIKSTFMHKQIRKKGRNSEELTKRVHSKKSRGDKGLPQPDDGITGTVNDASETDEQETDDSAYNGDYLADQAPISQNRDSDASAVEDIAEQVPMNQNNAEQNSRTIMQNNAGQAAIAMTIARQASLDQKDVGKATTVVQGSAEQTLIDHKNAEQVSLVQNDIEQSPIVQNNETSASMDCNRLDEAPIIQNNAEQVPVVQNNAEKAPIGQKNIEQSSLDQNNVEQALIAHNNAEQVDLDQKNAPEVPTIQGNAEHAIIDDNHAEQEKSYAGNEDLFAHPLTLDDPELGLVHEPSAKLRSRVKATHKRRKLKPRKVA